MEHFAKLEKSQKLFSVKTFVLAAILLILGTIIIFDRNILLLRSISENQLSLLIENYESKFKLVYSPLVFLEKISTTLKKTDLSKEQIESLLVLFFEYANFSHYQTANEPNGASFPYRKSEIFWGELRISNNSIILPVFLSMSGKEKNPSLIELELSLNSMVISQKNINGFVHIALNDNAFFAGIDEADWLSYEQNLVSWQETYKSYEKAKASDEGVKVDQYRVFSRVFDIDDSNAVSNATITFFLRESSMLANMNMVYIVASILLPSSGFSILFFVIIQYFRRKKRLLTDTFFLQIIQSGENEYIEFKSSFRYDYVQAACNRDLEFVILKSIAAFTNGRGGTILIGIQDGGSILGIQPDLESLKEQSIDYFELHLRNLADSAFGKDFTAQKIACSFYTFKEGENAGKQIARIDIKKSKEPVYIVYESKGKKSEKFFIRSGNSSRSLETPSEITRYLKNRYALKSL